ncbi:MAG: NAD-dependent epimerase/dehydratase family protein [Rhizobiaceae bacterium]
MTKILITGAAGTLGQRLSHAFEGRGDEVVGLDRPGHGQSGVVEADLSIWSDDWLDHFSAVDTVLHLAADPSPAATWASLQHLNMDMVLNVFEAAARGGVRRVIFASSNWVMGGYRTMDGPIRPSDDPFPINGYGATKLMGERIGHHFSRARGLSVICLRIGMAERPGGTPPSLDTPHGLWGQQMWLSNRDLLQAYEKAVDAPDDVRFAVLNLVSNNESSRWDLEPTRRTIGYRPQDGHPTMSNHVFELHEQTMSTMIWVADEQLRIVAKTGA